MKRVSLIVGLVFSTSSQVIFGWGEVGHHIIGRSAVRLLRNHPQIVERLKSASPEEKERIQSFLNTIDRKEVQQGHLSNIPDTHFRNLDEDLEQDGKLLGDATHYLDPENVYDFKNPQDFFKLGIPLSYDEAKSVAQKLKPGIDFYHSFGTVSWRSQQFYDLYVNAVSRYPKEDCAKLEGELHPTRVALTYAGLLSHFIGDSSMPYHATKDTDGITTGQKGIHSYFEEDLVSYLDRYSLAEKVDAASLERLVQNGSNSVLDYWNRAKTLYPAMNESNQVTALLFSLLGESYQHIKELSQLDLKFAVATLGEALEMDSCKNLPQVKRLIAEKAPMSTKILSEKDTTGRLVNACRRLPDNRFEGKKVAEWFLPMIIERLSISSALLADVWAKGYLAGGTPRFCWTYKYAHKPQFISPTDPICFGYALNEKPEHFLKKDKTSALPWKKSAKTVDDCLAF